MRKQIEFKPIKNAPKRVYNKPPNTNGRPFHDAISRQWEGVGTRAAARDKVRGTQPKPKKGLYK